MSRRKMYTGFMLGAAMLARVSGTAMAATQQIQPKKAVTQEAKKGAGTNKTTAGKQKDQTAADQKDKEKKDTALYGTIVKIDKEKMELKTAVVIWEKDAQKKDAKSDDSKAAAKDKKETKAAQKADQNDEKADFETDAMKWKADGKSIVVKFDKDTKFLKQVKQTEEKKNNTDKKDKKADNKKEQKTEKAAENETIKLEDLEEGAFVTVKVKEDGSMIATEVMVYEDVKENKKDAKKETTDAAGKTASNKNAGNKDEMEAGWKYGDYYI